MMPIISSGNMKMPIQVKIRAAMDCPDFFLPDAAGDFGSGGGVFCIMEI